MDTDGAGLATVIAQLLSGIACIVYIKKKHPKLHLKKEHFAFDRSLDRLLLKIGTPMAFLNMVLSVGGIVMQFVTNGLGTLYVSSQTTGSKIETFVTQPILSFGSAISMFAAQNYGAKKYLRVVEGTRKTLLMCYVWCVAASVIMLPFGRFIIKLIAGNVDAVIVENAYIYIIINTVLCLVLSPLVIYKSVLQSVGRTFLSMISGFTEILGRAGVSVLVIALMGGAALIGEQTGYILMCFASPLAWLFGLLTILPDYILMVKKFKKMPDAKA
jgi:Na+-driven multidrug efflux pump